MKSNEENSETAMQLPEGYVSMREYIKPRGLSHMTVINAITRGRVEGQMVNNRWYILKTDADREFTRNINRATVPTDYDKAKQLQDDFHPETGTKVCSLADAKVIREYFAGYEMRLKCEKMAGKLIPIDQAKHQFSETILKIKSELQSLPRSLTNKTAHLVERNISQQIESTLINLINACLTNVCAGVEMEE